MAIGIRGLGSYVPPRVVTNAEISAWTGATEQWIVERTGIHERRYAPEEEATSDLAVRAAQQALAEAPGGLDVLMVATCTPDVPQPATAAILQHKLGLRTVPAFDLNAACAGFVYSMVIAERMLADRVDGGALIVGADMFSTLMDRSDRRTVSLFGDGAGAAVLGHVPDGYGILGSRMLTDGEHHGLVGIEAGGTRTPLDAAARAAGAHLLRMNGPLVKDYVITTMRKLVPGVLDDCGLRLADIDRFVIHQANTRLLEAIAADLGIDPARLPMTSGQFGNTAGASVPLTLHRSHQERPLRRGDHVLLVAAGGGLGAGAVVVRWH